jgi:parallel beta-helix repeat protein
LEIRECNSGSVTNITFEQVAPDERTVANAWLCDAIELFNSSIQIKNCAASSASGCGICVSGNTSNPELSGNHCVANKLSGIAFESGATGVAVNNVLEQNEQSGVTINGSGTSPELAKNQCRNNKYHGIDFQSGAGGKADNNICERNEDSGIVVEGSGTNTELVKNQCRNNKHHGIDFQNGAGGKADNNICEQNELNGITVDGSGTNPELVSNQCRNNKYHGICFQKGAGGVASGNICQGNKWSGIAILASSPLVSGNQLLQNAQWGLIYGNGAKPRFDRKNIFSKTRWEMSIQTGSGIRRLLQSREFHQRAPRESVDQPSRVHGALLRGRIMPNSAQNNFQNHCHFPRYLR